MIYKSYHETCIPYSCWRFLQMFSALQVGNQWRISAMEAIIDLNVCFCWCVLFKSHLRQSRLTVDELCIKLPTWVTYLKKKVSNACTLAQTLPDRSVAYILKQFSYHSNWRSSKMSVVCTVVLPGLVRNLWEHVLYHCMLILTAWFVLVLLCHPGFKWVNHMWKDQCWALHFFLEGYHYFH